MKRVPASEILYKTYEENSLVKKNAFFKKKPKPVKLQKYDAIAEKLPQISWDGHENVTACYNKAWELAFSHLRNPLKGSGLISPFIDPAFNDCTFLWDSIFMLFFGKYGERVFKFQNTLDNFYAKQHPDGFICREIAEWNGTDRFARHDPTSTGPNLLAWSEWEYYLNFGDRKRLKEIFPVVLAYHQWTKYFRSWQDGGLWSSGWGCGMDNQPRMEEQYNDNFSHGFLTWVDTTMQQLLSANILIKIAKATGNKKEIPALKKEASFLAGYINKKLWDEKTGFYFDLTREGKFNYVKSIAAYWALIAEVVPKSRMKKFIAHLNNKKEFNRAHRVPTLSADAKKYNPAGEYWRGSIWAPTNYMLLRGLVNNGYEALAHEIAVNNVLNVTQVFENTGTLWENYAPDFIERGNQSRPNFVGWTGVIPITILLENVFGLRPDFNKGILEIDVRLTEGYSVKNYPFSKKGLLNIEVSPRCSVDEKPEVKISTNIPLKVKLLWGTSKKALFNIRK